MVLHDIQNSLEKKVENFVVETCKKDLPFISEFLVTGTLTIKVDITEVLPININGFYVKSKRGRKKKTSNYKSNDAQPKETETKDVYHLRKTRSSQHALAIKKGETAVPNKADSTGKATGQAVIDKETFITEDDSTSTNGTVKSQVDNESSKVNEDLVKFDKRFKAENVEPKDEGKAGRDFFIVFEEEMENADKNVPQEVSLDTSASTARELPTFKYTKCSDGRKQYRKGPQNCDICGELFKGPKLLVSHRFHDHEEELPYKCHSCKHRFKYQSELNVHKEIHLNYVCETCGKKLRTAREMEDHVNKHMGVRPHKCTCGSSFSSRKSLLLHQEVHKGELSHKCTDCERAFATANQLRVHVMCKHKVKKHKCKYCSKQFVARNQKLRHERIHTGVRPFKCKVCGKGYIDQQSLDQHFKIKHQGLRPFQCHECGKTFTSQTGINSHLKNIHYREKKLKCAFCDQRFRFKVRQLSHQIEKHGRGKYKCNFCQKEFLKLREKIHCESEHTQGRRYVCSTCGKGFKHSKQLKVHKLIHTGLKPHKCDQCHLAFAQKGNLKSHMTLHSNEKRFICEFCGMGFRYNSGLTRHKPSCPAIIKPKYPIHKVETEKGKMHACGICEKLYDRPNKVKRHIISQHREAISEEAEPQHPETTTGKESEPEKLDVISKEPESQPLEVSCEVAEPLRQVDSNLVLVEPTGTEAFEVESEVQPTDNLETVCCPSNLLEVSNPGESGSMLQGTNMIILPGQASQLGEHNLQQTVFELVSSPQVQDGQTLHHFYVIHEGSAVQALTNTEEQSIAE